MWDIVADFLAAWAAKQGRKFLEKKAATEGPDIQFKLFGLEIDIWVCEEKKPPVPKAKFLMKTTVGGKDFYFYRRVK